MRLIFALLLLIPTAPMADITIVTADRGNITAADMEIKVEGDLLTLHYTDTGGNKKKIRCDEVVEIRLRKSRLARKPNANMVAVELTSGDTVIGRLFKGEENKIGLNSHFLGKINIPFEKTRAIKSLKFAEDVPSDPGEIDSDLVYNNKGRKGKGYLVSVDDKNVTYYSIPLERNVDRSLEKFSAAFLTAQPNAPKAVRPKDLYAIFLASDGGRTQGRIEGLEGGVFTVKNLYGEEQKIPQGKVASVYFKNGRVVYLSDHDPTDVSENANYIRAEEPLPSDLDIPWRKDRNAQGGPIVIRTKEFRKGIGVHAYSSITWDISGAGYKKFHATIGLDDCGEGRGNVAFQVFVDDKEKLSREIDGGDAPADISIDVKGAKTLRLVVNFGKRANQGDYANWASARLIR